MKISQLFSVFLYKLHLKQLGIKSIPNIEKNGKISSPLKWHIIHVNQLWITIHKNCNAREGSKKKVIHIFNIDYDFFKRVFPPSPLSMLTDFITILWNIKNCPQCWTTPHPNLIKFLILDNILLNNSVEMGQILSNMFQKG